jgi:hypothetical protein
MGAVEKVEKMYVDLYIGDGADNPPVTIRLDRLERWAKDIRAMRAMMMATMLTVLGAIVVAFVGHAAGWKL